MAEGYTVNDEGGVDLDPEAYWCFATLLAARLIDSEWMDWGDVPNLSERSFAHLAACMEDIAKDLFTAAHSRAAAHDLDVLYIEEAATLAQPHSGSGEEGDRG